MSTRGRHAIPWIAAFVLTVIAAAAIVLLGGARSWAWPPDDEGRFLPGTSIAEVAVDGLPPDDARILVRAAIEAELDRTVTLAHDGEAWTVTLRDFGGDADVDAALAEAVERTRAATLGSLVRVRWLGYDAGIAVRAPISIDERRLDAFVAAVADRLDEPARDAAIAWDDGEVTATPSARGLAVDRDATARALRAALRGRTDVVNVEATILRPEVTTAHVRAALPAVREAAQRTLDHRVTVTGGGRTWDVAPADLGAVPDLDEVVGAALAAVLQGVDPDLGEATVDVALPDDAVDAFVAELAGAIDILPVDAHLDWSSGWIERVPGRDGVALDREHARTHLEAALRGDGDEVELEVGSARPRVSLDDFRHVLLLRQGERRLYLYRDGSIVREWPVAVGLAGSPTPTGVFTVGLKRANPTWYNPAPSGWGSDMPAWIGPGPDNPLGLRALNWNRDGRDTLIRFHGTPNESSIGEAASRGCVRMLNPDVVELFDLVPSGTVIVSLDVGVPPPPPEPEPEPDPEDEVTTGGGDDTSDDPGSSGQASDEGSSGRGDEDGG